MDKKRITLGELHTQSNNTSMQLGDRLFLKCYRRLRAGLHSELEVGRFLTEEAHFKHCVPLAGFFFQAEDGIRALYVTGVQTCALPISGPCAGCSRLTPAPASRHRRRRERRPAARSEERRVGKECSSRGRGHG